MIDYTDEALRDAIAQVRRGAVAVARVAEAIDPQEPLRERLDSQAAVLAGVLVELERILEEAVDELL